MAEPLLSAYQHILGGLLSSLFSLNDSCKHSLKIDLSHALSLTEMLAAIKVTTATTNIKI